MAYIESLENEMLLMMGELETGIDKNQNVYQLSVEPIGPIYHIH